MKEIKKDEQNVKNGSGTAEIVFILDKSGSMSGFESDTVGGFNSTLASQKKLDGKAYVTTIFFSNSSETVHDRVPIEKVEPLKLEDYRPGGCTALIDAVGGAIDHIADIHKYARPEDVPSRTVFIITTDGLENASRTYTSDKVKSMIKTRTEEYGWEFIFMAADIDAVETARSIGIREERAVNYRKDSAGAGASFGAMNLALKCVRSEKCLDSSEWRAEADRDYERDEGKGGFFSGRKKTGKRIK